MKLLLALLLTATAHAGSNHAHTPGPNGGRLLTAVEPHVEFFVTPARTLRLTFVDDANKPLAPAAQEITVITGDRSAPTKITFTREGNALVSAQPLPPGDKLPVIVQIKATPDAKPAVEKFNLNLATCPGCQRPEYTCTCAH